MIYTTPLKALSNQKLFEMRERFGTERVGLSTGDASIQTDSHIMVMTTEILRNIMYRTEEDSADDNSSVRDSLADVGLVVLDEVTFVTFVTFEHTPLMQHLPVLAVHVQCCMFTQYCMFCNA